MSVCQNSWKYPGSPNLNMTDQSVQVGDVPCVVCLPRQWATCKTFLGGLASPPKTKQVESWIAFSSFFARENHSGASPSDSELIRQTKWLQLGRWQEPMRVGQQHDGEGGTLSGVPGLQHDDS